MRNKKYTPALSVLLFCLFGAGANIKSAFGGEGSAIPADIHLNVRTDSPAYQQYLRDLAAKAEAESISAENPTPPPVSQLREINLEPTPANNKNTSDRFKFTSMLPASAQENSDGTLLNEAARKAQIETLRQTAAGKAQ